MSMSSGMSRVGGRVDVDCPFCWGLAIGGGHGFWVVVVDGDLFFCVFGRFHVRTGLRRLRHIVRKEEPRQGNPVYERGKRCRKWRRILLLGVSVPHMQV